MAKQDAPTYMADAQYRVILYDMLPAQIQAEFSQIPGVAVWRRRPGLFVPYNAGWYVEARLKQARIPHKFDAPRLLMTPDTVQEVQEILAASELVEDIWYPFATDYQRDATVQMVKSGSSMLVAPAGSGKTLAYLMWALAAGGPILNVTKAGARRQLADEVRRFTTLEPFILLPKGEYRKRDRFQSMEAYLDFCYNEGQRPWVIGGWEGLASNKDDILGLLTPSQVIYDEIHKARQNKRANWNVTIGDDGKENWTEERLQHRATVAEDISAVAIRRFGATATPVARGLVDMWGQMKLIEPKAWGKTSRRFEIRYCNGQPGDYGGLVHVPPGHSNRAELGGRLAFGLVRISKEVVRSQIPPMRRMMTTIHVADQDKPTSMARADRSEYKKEMKAIGKAIAMGTATYWQKNRMSEQLRLDAASRKRSFLKQRMYDVDTMGKGKGLLFTGRLRDVDELYRLASIVANGRYPVFKITGETPEHERWRIVNEYMTGNPETPWTPGVERSPGPARIIGTYQAFGESLNLQDTDWIGVAMLPTTPDQIEQLEGRGGRLGQERPLIVEYFVAEETIDDRLMSLLIARLPAVEVASAEASGLEGFSATLRGLEDIDGLLDKLVDNIDDYM